MNTNIKNVEKGEIINALIEAAYNVDRWSGNAGYNSLFYENLKEEIENDINSDMSIEEFRVKYTINLHF